MAKCADPFHFALGRNRTVVVQRRAMAHDEQTRLRFRNVGRNFPRPLQEQFCDGGMIPDRFAIFPNLAARSGRQGTIQLQLARDNRLGEISFADEIRHHVNFADLGIIEEEERIAKARLFLPETTGNFTEEPALPDRRRLGQTRRARVGIDGRTVADDEKGTGSRRDRHGRLNS